MGSRMLAHDAHNGRARLACVVKIRQPVAESWAQMQECRRGSSGYSCIAVRRAGTDALKQTQHAAQPTYAIKGRDKVHLRCARIHEARIHAVVDERPQER